MKVNKTIIKLGKHILIYGDATKSKYYDNYNDSVDLLLTDPPYNLNYKGAVKHKRKGLLNDNLKDKYRFFVYDLLKNAQNIMKQGSCYYIFCSSKEVHTFQNVLSDLDFYQSSQLIWTKQHFVLSFADYKAKHEHIMYGWKKGAAHQFYGQKNCSSVLPFNRLMKSTHHPTMKPRPLLNYLITNSTKEGDTVLDLCGGSGNTLLSFQELNRKCIMVELDQKYIKTIIYRFQYDYPNEKIIYTTKGET